MNSTPSSPKPTPGPSPAAMAKKAKPGAASPASLARAASSRNTGAGSQKAKAAQPHHTDPKQFGRIDDEGTVWLKTPEGERAIGSWQAGSKEAGLQHFAARYSDLETEVDLLNARLDTHPGDASHVKEKAEQLLAELPTAAVIGDVPALSTKLTEVINRTDSAAQKFAEDKAARRQAAIEQKQQLAAEAEDIAENSTDWKAAGDRLREILGQWKQIRGIDRATDDELWRRYARARDSFNRRRGAHFAELDRNRAQARRVKEELVEQAEAIQDSTDWGGTARAYRDLMQQWKAAGRAPREIDDKLWNRFRAAQDHFFAARDEVNAARDAEFENNAALKQALIDEYTPRIDPDNDLDQARVELRKLQTAWDEIGFVPRGRVREFEDKIGALERKVAGAADAKWRRTDPEANARVQQFVNRAKEFEARAEELEAAGKADKAAEARSQAAQWRSWADTAAQTVEDL